MLNGFIAMVIYSSMSDNLGFDIWVLLEFGVMESWTKLITIDPSLDLKRPCCFGRVGRFLWKIQKGSWYCTVHLHKQPKMFNLTGIRDRYELCSPFFPCQL